MEEAVAETAALIPPATATTTSTATACGASATTALPLTASRAKYKTGWCSWKATGPVPKADRNLSRFYFLNYPKDFKWEKGLKEHLRERCRKTEKNLGSAVFVKNNFIMEESMLDHIGMFHTGQKQHKCHICPEAFSTERIWKRTLMKNTRN